MTHDDDGRHTGDARLDAQLRALPLEVTPSRDLWPDIASRIAAPTSATMPGTSRRSDWRWQVAAAIVLVAGSSLLTATLLDSRAPAAHSAQQSSSARAVPGVAESAVQGAAAAMPAAFGPRVRLGDEYVAARQQLTRMLDERIAALPPSARAKLEFNLGEMRRAAEEINAALAAQPGDPLLEELLLKTYQDELAVLSNVNELTHSLGRNPATEGEKRMQL